jgi:uncharacterized protein YicC (UPF0701 family)
MIGNGKKKPRKARVSTKRATKVKPTQASEFLAAMLASATDRLQGARREEYELLATYLCETVDKLSKQANRAAQAQAQCTMLDRRATSLRAQLAVFEPELDFSRPPEEPKPAGEAGAAHG